MSLYRVDKREQPVVLFLADGVVREGTVFLSPFSQLRSGPQTLLDLFHEKEPFMPFRGNDGRFTLLNKSAVTHLRYHDDAEEHLGERLNVRLTFYGGENLEGTLTIAMPEGMSRLQDYVNSSPGFFPVETPDARYLINGALIREIAQC